MNSSDLKIDFLNDPINYRRKSHRGKQELIARAVGATKGVKHVIDLTCGLAQDAFFLVQLGFQVTAIERSSELFKILDQSYHKAIQENPDSEWMKRFKIINQDSKLFLQSSEFKNLDKQNLALYLDPMFPEKKKSALPRKEMQIFRSLVGDDLDAGDLLSIALSSGVPRVVVKRPLRAPALLKKPIHFFEGKTIRYDLY